jgi:hypothetical protein
VAGRFSRSLLRPFFRLQDQRGKRKPFFGSFSYPPKLNYLRFTRAKFLRRASVRRKLNGWFSFFSGKKKKRLLAKLFGRYPTRWSVRSKIVPSRRDNLFFFKKVPQAPTSYVPLLGYRPSFKTHKKRLGQLFRFVKKRLVKIFNRAQKKNRRLALKSRSHLSLLRIAHRFHQLITLRRRAVRMRRFGLLGLKLKDVFSRFRGQKSFNLSTLRDITQQLFQKVSRIGRVKYRLPYPFHTRRYTKFFLKRRLSRMRHFFTLFKRFHAVGNTPPPIFRSPSVSFTTAILPFLRGLRTGAWGQIVSPAVVWRRQYFTRRTRFGRFFFRNIRSARPFSRFFSRTLRSRTNFALSPSSFNNFSTYFRFSGAILQLCTKLFKLAFQRYYSMFRGVWLPFFSVFGRRSTSERSGSQFRSVAAMFVGGWASHYKQPLVALNWSFFSHFNFSSSARASTSLFKSLCFLLNFHFSRFFRLTRFFSSGRTVYDLFKILEVPGWLTSLLGISGSLQRNKARFLLPFLFATRFPLSTARRWSSAFFDFSLYPYAAPHKFFARYKKPRFYSPRHRSAKQFRLRLHNFL